MASPRLNIDVFVAADVNTTTDMQVHTTGIWRSLGPRHDVRVWVWRPATASVLEGEPFQIVFLPRRAVRGSGWLSRCLGLVAALVLLLRLLLAFSRRRPDAIYVPETVSPAPFAAARILRIPLLLEVNGALGVEAPSHWFESAFLQPLLRWQARSAARVLPVTERLRTYVTKRYGIKPGRVTVVGVGAEEGFRPQPEEDAKLALGLETSARYICWTGSRAYWHALSELLEAFAILRREEESLRLVLLVRNPRPSVYEDIARLGLQDYVTVTGVPHDQVPDYLCAARVCVAPFLDVPRHHLSGVAPLKVAEYLACGRPVVATRLPGLEFIEPEGLGRLYQGGDVAGLASALAAVMALDDGERQAISARCRAYAEAHYDWRELAREVEQELFAAAGRRLEEAFEEPARER